MMEITWRAQSDIIFRLWSHCIHLSHGRLKTQKDTENLGIYLSISSMCFPSLSIVEHIVDDDAYDNDNGPLVVIDNDRFSFQ